MKFATTYPLISHPYHPGLVSPDGIARVSQAAEAAGFSGIGFTDHPAPSQRWLDGGGHDALDPFVAMAFCAAATTTIRLIPNVVVLPYRNPFIVAKAGATLDLLSGGRFTLSVGAGYLKSEFAALGVDHAERNELFDEAIDVLRAIWTTDDVTFEGRHFSARGITSHPRPAVCPPIWIGGNSAQARQRVAERGDGWAPFPSPAGVAQRRAPRRCSRLTTWRSRSPISARASRGPAGRTTTSTSPSPATPAAIRRANASTRRNTSKGSTRSPASA